MKKRYLRLFVRTGIYSVYINFVLSVYYVTNMYLFELICTVCNLKPKIVWGSIHPCDHGGLKKLVKSAHAFIFSHVGMQISGTSKTNFLLFS